MIGFWLQFSIMIAVLVYVALIILPDLWKED
jgi:hypothetical protein